jgi:hypothetical protein
MRESLAGPGTIDSSAVAGIRDSSAPRRDCIFLDTNSLLLLIGKRAAATGMGWPRHGLDGSGDSWTGEPSMSW